MPRWHLVKNSTVFINNKQWPLPYPSFVQSRHTDQGFSHKGDGTDYPPAWNGQFALDAYYFSSILHGTPYITKNL
ncbi:MAG: hypothetical protein HC797_08355, partial [Anaerolineales bacterium]|nr:hypothetical protein [Anaerolineales bacterium]